MAVRPWLVRLSVVTFASLITGNFQNYSTLIINNLQAPLTLWLKEYFNKYTVSMFIIPLIAVAPNAGSLIGDFLCMYFLDRFGRRSVAIACSITAIVSSSLILIAFFCQSVFCLVTAQMISGAIYSILMINNTLLIAESVPQDKRGFFCAFPTIFAAMGNCAGALFASPLLFGTMDQWPLALLVGYLPFCFSLPIFFWAPDSPRHIYLADSDPHEAERALEFYQGPENVAETLADLENERSKQSTQISYRELFFTSKAIRRSVVLQIVLNLRKQFVAETVLSQFSTLVLTQVGFLYSTASSITVIATVVRFASSLVCPPIVQCSPRRFLTLTSTLACILVILAIATISAFDLNFGALSAVSSASLLCLYFVVFNLMVAGAEPLKAELLPQNARAKGNVIGKIANDIVSTIIAFTFPLAVEALKNVDIPIYILSFLAMITLWYLWKNLPETKDRTFQETHDELCYLLDNNGNHETVLQ